MCKVTDETICVKSVLTVDVTPKKRRRRRRRKTNSDSIDTSDSSTCDSGSQASPVPKQTKPKRNRRRRRKNKNSQEEISEEERQRYVALDCEMVGVGPGGYTSALARVCIIGWDEEVVLDTFVKVSEPITDYRTFVSGVRKEDLESDQAMEINECRALVASIIEGKIVVGHALKNDFQALKLSHPWYDTRDTAKYTPLMQKCDRTGIMKARRLKDLVHEKLNKDIQCDGNEHSPYEDASAALSLYKNVRRKWEKVMEYKFNKTLQITQQSSSSSSCSSSSSELSAEDYENILEFFASQ